MKYLMHAMMICSVTVGCMATENGDGGLDQPSIDGPQSVQNQASQTDVVTDSEEKTPVGRRLSAIFFDGSSDSPGATEPDFENGTWTATSSAQSPGDQNEPSEDAANAAYDRLHVEHSGEELDAEVCATMCPQLVGCLENVCALGLSDGDIDSLSAECTTTCTREKPRASQLENVEILVANGCAEMRAISESMCPALIEDEAEWVDEVDDVDDAIRTEMDEIEWTEVQQGDAYPEAEPGDDAQATSEGFENEEDIAQPNQPACTHMCDELFGPEGSKRTQSCIGQLLADLDLPSSSVQSLNACHAAADNSQIVHEVCIYASQTCL